MKHDAIHVHGARRRPECRPPARLAFTLLEVLLALSLSIALIAAMFGFYWDMLSTRERVIKETARHRAATTLIENIERDLMSCLVGDAASGAGVSGDESSLRILSRGVAVRVAADDGAGATVFSDLEASEYRFDAGRMQIEMSRSVIDARERASDSFAPLGGAIYKMRFRYHDGTRWRDAFNSLEEDRLPTAIEVAIWFDAWPGEEDSSAGSNADEADSGFAPAERLTFDTGAGFDEQAYAELSDLETFDEPQPDRVRVIVVPDAEAGEESVAEDESDAALDVGSNG